MKLAEYIDTHSSGGGGGGEGGGGLKEWFLSSKAEVLDMLAQEVGRQERGRRERQAERRVDEIKLILLWYMWSFIW